MKKNAIVVTVCGTKGGTGKTSTSVNLGGLLADLGKSVCMVDADIQPALSTYYPLTESPDKFLTDLITSKSEDVCLDAFATKTNIENLSVIVSDDPQGKLQDWVTQTVDGRVRLRQTLHRPSDFDYIIVDTQGTHSPLHQASVLAADMLISPIPPEIISAKEFARGTLEMLEALKPMEAYGAPLGSLYALIYRMDRTKDSQAIANQLVHSTFEQSSAKIRILGTIIPSLVAYREAATRKIPVHRHDKRALGKMGDLVSELFPSLKETVMTFVGKEGV